VNTLHKIIYHYFNIDHELVELFPKRNFKCDCGTARLGGAACKLDAKPRNTLNEHNRYDHNYEGRFCWLASYFNKNFSKFFKLNFIY